MPKHNVRLTALCALFFSPILSACANASADTDASWQMLSFEAKSIWATAQTEISLITHDSDKFGKVWELQLHGNVSSSSEQENIFMTPGSGGLLERDRFTKGKNQRLKHYDYNEKSISRIRREPGAESSAQLPPWEWPISNTKQLNRPSQEECPVLTAIPSLLIFANKVPEAPGQSFGICVHSDHNFYRVTMTVKGEKNLTVNYRLGDTQKKVKAKKTTTVIALSVDRVGDEQGEADFSLLGLSSPVTILLDREAGLPVQVRGQAPRLGKTEINLIEANLGPVSPH